MFRRPDGDQSAPSTPRSSKKKHGATSATATATTPATSSNSKNPYSSRGLEKFSLVRSELEAKKEKIMARTGSDVAMVRFKYSSSQDWIPIVVKIREDNSSKSNPSSPKPKPKPAPAQPNPHELPTASPPSPSPAAEKKVKKRVTWSEGKKGGELWKWRPSYYILGLVLLILICLMVSGRFFAVCCTAVWWYSMPLLKGADQESDNTRRWLSKEYVGKLNDKKLSSASASASTSAAGSGSSAAVKKMAGGGVQEVASPRANVIHGKRG